MEKPTVDSLFASAARMLNAEFQRAKADVPHYGERGEELEQILIGWLNKHLPGRFKAGTGFILDDQGNITPQTDVIIFDAFNNPLLRHSEKSFIVESDAAAVAIEVKSKLTKDGFDDAAAKIEKVKSLCKCPISDFDLLPPGVDKIVQRQTMGILFAYESEVSLETVGKWWAEAFQQRPGYNGRHIDFICILEKGWLSMQSQIPGREGFGTMMRTEPIMRPRTVPVPLKLWIGAIGYPERALLAFFNYIMMYLATFRNKMYMPGKSFFQCEGQMTVIPSIVFPEWNGANDERVQAMKWAEPPQT